MVSNSLSQPTELKMPPKKPSTRGQKKKEEVENGDCFDVSDMDYSSSDEEDIFDSDSSDEVRTSDEEFINVTIIQISLLAGLRNWMN